MKKTFTQVFTLTTLTTLVSAQALAAGFQLQEQNAALLGQAFAGRAAYANDAATEFDNPAGLTRLKHKQLVVSLVPAFITIETRGTSISALGSPPAPPAETGKSGAGKDTVIPALFYAHPITDNVVFALGIYSPFGLITEHEKGSYARYSGTYSRLMVIDISPALAIRFNDHWSAGAALNFEYADVDFDSQFPLQPFGVIPNQDANVHNEGDDWSLGWHAGVLYEHDDNTRVGATYHSEVKHHLTGSSTFDTDPLGSFKSSNLSANLTLPAYASLGAYHAINPQWAVLGEIDYINWSTVDVITLKNVASPIGPTNSSFVQNYRNTWRFSLGGNYQQTEKVMWRAGIAYDQTPTRDSFRSTRLPDGDRIVTGLGAHIALGENASIDLSYAHFFIDDSKLASPTDTGKGSGSADLFGIQFTLDIV